MLFLTTDPPPARPPLHAVTATLAVECREQWELTQPVPVVAYLALDGAAPRPWLVSELAPGRWHLRELGDSGDGYAVDTFARTCSCPTWRLSPEARPCEHVYACEAVEHAVERLPAGEEDGMPVVRIAVDAHIDFDPAEYARWAERASDESDLATLLAWVRTEPGSPLGRCSCRGAGRICLACRVREILERRVGR